jgi:Ni,Fe-hydrogenase III large subunit
MNTQQYATLKNQGVLPMQDLPVLSYVDYFQTADELLRKEGHHCVNCYGHRTSGNIQLICCIADDFNHTILVFSTLVNGKLPLESLSKNHFPMHMFEREIAENFGIEFIDHPWPKPVRYAWNRSDREKVINNYPFYRIDGGELHEVGVGPIHAGVIEPGHFRFLCNGETVLHLEIQLGWQHRGMEALFLEKSKLIQRTVLSESIAGDTALGHSLAFVSMMESLGSIPVTAQLELERTMALELERIAMHLGDLGNVNIGMAYQLASSVFGTLRTPVINYTQTWCGNRFGKGLNRVGGTNYPFNDGLRRSLVELLNKVETTFEPMAERMFSLPSFLMRAEAIGKVTEQQMRLIGAVGMTARVTGILSDIRQSHPFSAYKNDTIESQVLDQGDVWARMMLRKLETSDSIRFVRDLALRWNSTGSVAAPRKEQDIKLTPNALCVSLVEGWRGEICHCGITDDRGSIVHYKIKDPSFHNWLALSLSLRDLEISDFPINNKSYNLSYCGFDL